MTLSKDYVIDPGKTMAVKPLKENGKAKLELSSIPPIDLSRRLEYLVRYPHGCIEQITSGELIIGERVVNNLEPKDRDCAMVF